MVILTIGLVSMAELLAVSLRMQQLGRNETAAIRLAQDKLDQLSVLNFDAELTVQPGGDLDDNDDNHWDTPLDADGNPLQYVRRWFIEAGPDGATTQMRQITIRVIPTNPDARTTGTFEMISIIRRI